MKHLNNYKKFILLCEGTDIRNYPNKTSFMTLDEYKKEVSPVIKGYRKFLKENFNYFKEKGWSGMEQYTYPEYELDKIEKLKKMGIENIANKEYALEEWIKSGREYIKEIPKEIYNDYLDYIDKLKYLFGEQINKVEPDETNNNKRSIRRAIDDDTYIEALIDGDITPKRLETIIQSVGLKLPKRILDMKSKVETEGYNRALEDKLTERNTQFGEKIKYILYNDDIIKSLKERKRKSIINLVESFEESNINDIYKFSMKIQKSNPDANSLLNKLFKSSDISKHRVNNFDNIIESITTNYVDIVISKFIYRTNQKLSVINNKIGLPNVNVGEFHVTNDIEGEISLMWDNGFELILKAKIILAGGSYLQRLHERYLLHFFKNGKKIEIEQIDKSF